MPEANSSNPAGPGPRQTAQSPLGQTGRPSPQAPAQARESAPDAEMLAKAQAAPRLHVPMPPAGSQPITAAAQDAPPLSGNASPRTAKDMDQHAAASARSGPPHRSSLCAEPQPLPPFTVNPADTAGLPCSTAGPSSPGVAAHQEQPALLPGSPLGQQQGVGASQPSALPRKTEPSSTINKSLGKNFGSPPAQRSNAARSATATFCERAPDPPTSSAGTFSAASESPRQISTELSLLHSTLTQGRKKHPPDRYVASPASGSRKQPQQQQQQQQQKQPSQLLQQQLQPDPSQPLDPAAGAAPAVAPAKKRGRPRSAGTAGPRGRGGDSSSSRGRGRGRGRGRSGGRARGRCIPEPQAPHESAPQLHAGVAAEDGCEVGAAAGAAEYTAYQPNLPRAACLPSSSSEEDESAKVSPHKLPQTPGEGDWEFTCRATFCRLFAKQFTRIYDSFSRTVDVL